MDKNYSPTLKIVLAGDGDVGKTSLMIRQVDNIFHPMRICSMGVDFKCKQYQIGEFKIKGQIWDGMSYSFEKLQSMNRRYYKDAYAIGLCFNLAEKSTFDRIEQRINMIKKVKSNAKMFLIGCKGDLDSVFSDEQMIKFGNSYGIKYIKTSSKSNQGVNQVFQEMAKQGFNIKMIEDSKFYESLSSSKSKCQIM